MLRTLLILISTLLLAAALAACGGDDDEAKPASSGSSGGATSQPTSASSKQGKKLVEDPCGAVSLEDVRAVLPDAKAGEVGRLTPDAASCIWRSAAKQGVSVELILITPRKDQVDGVKAAYAKTRPNDKVDVGDVGYIENEGLVFFKGNATVTIAATGTGATREAIVALGKKFAAKA